MPRSGSVRPLTLSHPPPACAAVDLSQGEEIATAVDHKPARGDRRIPFIAQLWRLCADDLCRRRRLLVQQDKAHESGVRGLCPLPTLSSSRAVVGFPSSLCCPRRMRIGSSFLTVSLLHVAISSTGRQRPQEQSTRKTWNLLVARPYPGLTERPGTLTCGCMRACVSTFRLYRSRVQE